ncbi:AraC-type DNA-binding protein [Pseudovibrio ascidiaceicola]|uniref:AraC-type DNA-binding protein n=1 Tax=Pseudovibrio ascidiaceicola TaxID=285279 RepID=A0A1I3Y106_9HYPH|nr:helix-turn-helix domain-containing protein [Pseudovibrio ascidiaceicola]SFK25534.1 AraC-type DNA-binding protein [Pseudovibrio ascidiaceicola]
MNAQQSDASTLPRNHFSLNVVEQHERFDLWRESLGCLYEVEASCKQSRQTFFGDIKSVLLENVILSDAKAQSHLANRSSAAMARDGLDHYLLLIKKSGSGEFWSNKTRHQSKPGDCIFVDLSQEAFSTQTAYSNFTMLIPRSKLDPLVKDAADLHNSILHAADPLVTLLKEHICLLAKQSLSMSYEQAQAIIPASIGLLAACLQSNERHSDQEQSGIKIALLGRARRIIEANLNNPNLTPAYLCKSLGITRANLYVLFEPLGGVSSYIRQYRLRAVARAILSSTNKFTSIYQIAQEYGFTNESSFSRLFKQRFGMSPSDAREQKGALLAHATKEETEGRRFETWVQHLR